MTVNKTKWLSNEAYEPLHTFIICWILAQRPVRRQTQLLNQMSIKRINKIEGMEVVETYKQNKPIPIILPEDKMSEELYSEEASDNCLQAGLFITYSQKIFAVIISKNEMITLDRYKYTSNISILDQ